MLRTNKICKCFKKPGFLFFFFATTEQNKTKKTLHNYFASTAKDCTWKTLDKSTRLIELELLEVKLNF